jgi:hypothetical protein
VDGQITARIDSQAKVLYARWENCTVIVAVFESNSRFSAYYSKALLFPPITSPEHFTPSLLTLCRHRTVANRNNEAQTKHPNPCSSLVLTYVQAPRHPRRDYRQNPVCQRGLCAQKQSTTAAPNPSPTLIVTTGLCIKRRHQQFSFLKTRTLEEVRNHSYNPTCHVCC